jgi:hypothetical protein
MPRATKQAITPEDYKKILSGLEIVRIDVDEYSGKVLNRAGLYASDKKRTVNLTEKARFEAIESGDVVIWHAYNIVVTLNKEEAAAKLMTFSVEFRVHYASEEPFTSDFFEQFRKLSLQIQTAPFARAWIQDHCLRMGVPPLILPLVRTP